MRTRPTNKSQAAGTKFWGFLVTFTRPLIPTKQQRRRTVAAFGREKPFMRAALIDTLAQPQNPEGTWESECRARVRKSFSNLGVPNGQPYRLSQSTPLPRSGASGSMWYLNSDTGRSTSWLQNAWIRHFHQLGKPPGVVSNAQLLGNPGESALEVG
jgi:hypothetical protein